MRVAAVVPAGGSGTRMGGAGVRKQYLELAGEPILLRSIRPLVADPRIEWVVVALPAEDVESPPFDLPAGVVAVAGGADRGESVRRALAAVPEAADVVLIHDGARPLVSADVVARTLGSVTPTTGAIAAVRVVDTIKRVSRDGAITATVDRSDLWQAQTPQAFPRAMIMDAYARAAEDGVEATDDAALVERYGGRVVVVEGDTSNMKVTRPEDLALADLLLSAQSH